MGEQDVLLVPPVSLLLLACPLSPFPHLCELRLILLAAKRVNSSPRLCLFRKDVTLKRGTNRKYFDNRKGEKRRRSVRGYRRDTLKFLSSSFICGGGGGATEFCIFPSTHASRCCVMSSDTEYGRVSPVIVLTVSHTDKLRRRHCVCTGVQCESHGPVTLEAVIADCFS